MNSPAEVIDQAIEIINNSKKLDLEIKIIAKDDPNISKTLKVGTEGIHKAKTNKEDLVVECDFPGDENNNTEFVSMLDSMQQFYIDNSAYLLITKFKFTTEDGCVIDSTVDTFTPFPRFCSFRVSVEDLEITKDGQRINVK